MNIFAQGDCLLFQELIPETATEIILNPVLLHGENGHQHQLESDSKFDVLYEPTKKSEKKYEIRKDPNSNVIYLRIFRSTDLIHEEHDKITIPPGDYRMGQVREQDMFSGMIRTILD